LYAPVPVWMGRRWQDALPAVRRWEGSDRNGDGFVRIASARRIYLPEPWRRRGYMDVDTFHTVTTCDLAARDFDCTAKAVLGQSSRTFYVSQSAVYVWTGNLGGRGRRAAMVYRMPLDRGAPQAVMAAGNPVDQFSFREDAGRLDVVVRERGGGDGMWRSERTGGDAALLQVPLSAFGDGSGVARAAAYRPLPADGWQFHNRFVGRFLLYGVEGGVSVNVLNVVPVDGGAATRLDLPHAVGRLDAIGGDGVVIGMDGRGSLGFSAIGLGARVRIEDSDFFPHAREGENRSQAFFYRPDPGDAEGTSGMMALPITRELTGGGTKFLGAGSEIAFLSRVRRKLAPAGELVADAANARDDGCLASCVDWYGNARPIFLGDRLFALMGYELVEGSIDGGVVREARRLDFSPAGARVAR